MRAVTRSALLVLALLAAGCGGGEETPPAGDESEATEQSETEQSEAAAAETFVIVSGSAPDEGAEDLGVFDFYPSSVQVRPGDTLQFTNGSGAIPVPHTVTRGTGADIAATIPPPVAPPVGQVPAAWGACVSEEPLAPTDTACPQGDAAFPPEGDTLELPAFADQGFYNSGIFDKGQAVMMPIADDAPPGTYSFVCYLHPATMEMTVDVVDGDEPVQTQEELDVAAEEAIAADLEDGQAALAAAEQAEQAPGTVQAGAEQGRAVITRFFPSEITVPAGSTVTWVNEGADPHVVAFGAEVAPHGPENFAPPTVPPGGDYLQGAAISGVFGAPPFPATSYALRFPNAGTYSYVCPIHPGMAGTVEVT
jgi:plastocyanin